MDIATITLITGLVSCVIGVSTFVTGRMAKAERNGSMETKINQALEGITSINRKLEASNSQQHSVELLVRSHEEQIKTLFRTQQDIKVILEDGNKTREVLVEILQEIKTRK